MRTNVKSYSDKQLLNRVEEIGGVIPNLGNFLIIGVQSQEDAFNVFDDKFYVFDGHKFKQVSSGTTNAGRTALLHYDNYGLSGAAVWKTNEFYKDCFVRGFHKGRMRALRANRPIKYYRDTNKDFRADETGELFFENIYANMHGVDYNPYSNVIKGEINGWSFACQVWNVMSDYRHMVNAVWKRNKPVDYAIIKEF